MTILVFCVLLVAFSLVVSRFVPALMRSQAWRRRPGYLVTREMLGFTIEPSRHIQPGTAIVIGTDYRAWPLNSSDTSVMSERDDYEKWYRQFRFEQQIALQVRCQPNPKSMVIITGIS